MSSVSFPVVPNGVVLLGEVVCWKVPTGTVIRHADMVAALQGAGLDASAARVLCKRHAFVRACRELSADRIVRRLHEDNGLVTFQFTAEVLDAGQFRYDFEATVSMDKATGAVTGSDPALAQRVETELNACEEDRTVTDITRVVNVLFRRHADLFPIREQGGAYFVPQAHAAFIGQVEQFLAALGGRLARFPIPDGTPQGNTSVSTAVADGLTDILAEYEASIAVIDCNTRDSTLDRAFQLVQAAAAKVHFYRQYLGSHAARLEDHVAWLGKMLRDRKEEAEAQKLVEGALADVMAS